MKIVTKILPALCIMLVAIMFSGCSIKAPVVSVNGCLVSWNWVTNATEYEVNVNGTSYFTTDNNYNLAPLIQKSRTIKEVRVRAITSNSFLSNSGYSDMLTVAVGDKILDTPQNFKVDISTNSYICSWDTVANADYYCIKLVNLDNNSEQYFATNGRSYNLYGATNESGSYQAFVFAYSNSQSHIYAPSELSNSVDFMMDVTLDTPKGITLSKVSGSIICSWPTIPEAESYSLSILNGETYTVPNNVNVDTQSFNLSSKGLTLNAGEAIFACVGAVGAENSGYTESPYTDMASIFGTGTKNDFQAVKYDFLGDTFDLVADNYDELQTIVWYTIFYRINEIQCYINYKITDNSLKNIFQSAIQSYNEIRHLQYAITPLGSGAYSLRINYVNPMYPTKTTDKSSAQYLGVQPKNYTDTPRDDSYNDFAIENREKTFLVYNSEQLYYVVQNGYRPIFPGGDSPAEVAYEAAKDVLRDIVSDDMSDYEKTVAIYEWVCYTAHYDHTVIDIDAEIAAGLRAESISNYRSFYIEGMLFDGGQVVCDGISKTFALLCGIEDIECYKVIGIGSYTGSSSQTEVDHAWNKVKLDLVGNDGIGEWYAVDATQNDFTDNISTEYLTHMSFLKTDEWMSTVLHHREVYPCTDVANTEFSFYANSTYDGSSDYVISSASELSEIANFAKSTFSSVEFIIDLDDFADYNYVNTCAVFNKGTVRANIYSMRIDDEGIKPYVIFLVYYSTY